MDDDLDGLEDDSDMEEFCIHDLAAKKDEGSVPSPQPSPIKAPEPAMSNEEFIVPEQEDMVDPSQALPDAPLPLAQWHDAAAACERFRIETDLNRRIAATTDQRRIQSLQAYCVRYRDEVEQAATERRQREEKMVQDACKLIFAGQEAGALMGGLAAASKSRKEVLCAYLPSESARESSQAAIELDHQFKGEIRKLRHRYSEAAWFQIHMQHRLHAAGGAAVTLLRDSAGRPLQEIGRGPGTGAGAAPSSTPDPAVQRVVEEQARLRRAAAAEQEKTSAAMRELTRNYLTQVLRLVPPALPARDFASSTCSGASTPTASSGSGATALHPRDVLASPTKVRRLPGVAASPIGRVQDRNTFFPPAGAAGAGAGAGAGAASSGPQWYLRRPVFHSFGTAVSVFAEVHARVHSASATRAMDASARRTSGLRGIVARAEEAVRVAATAGARREAGLRCVSELAAASRRVQEQQERQDEREDEEDDRRAGRVPRRSRDRGGRGRAGTAASASSGAAGGEEGAVEADPSAPSADFKAAMADYRTFCHALTDCIAARFPDLLATVPDPPKEEKEQEEDRGSGKPAAARAAPAGGPGASSGASRSREQKEEDADVAALKAFRSRMMGCRRRDRGSLLCMVCDAVAAHAHGSLFPHYAARFADQDAFLSVTMYLLGRLCPADFGVVPHMRLDACERAEGSKVKGDRFEGIVHASRGRSGLGPWEDPLDLPDGEEGPMYEGETEDDSKMRKRLHKQAQAQQRRLQKAGKPLQVPAVRVPAGLREELQRIAAGSYERSVAFLRMLQQARTAFDKRMLFTHTRHALLRSNRDYYLQRYPGSRPGVTCRVDLSRLQPGQDELQPMSLYLLCTSGSPFVFSQLAFAREHLRYVEAWGGDTGAMGDEDYALTQFYTAARGTCHQPRQQPSLVLAALGIIE